MSTESKTPETSAFMTLIDDSTIDLWQVEAKLGDMELQRDAARAEATEANANQQFGWETAREAHKQYEKEHTELLALRAEVTRLTKERDEEISEAESTLRGRMEYLAEMGFPYGCNWNEAIHAQKLLRSELATLRATRDADNARLRKALEDAQNLLRDWIRAGECFCIGELIASRGRCDWCRTNEYFSLNPQPESKTTTCDHGAAIEALNRIANAPYWEFGSTLQKYAKDALVATVTNSQQKGGDELPSIEQLAMTPFFVPAPTSDPEGAATPADLTFAIPNSLEASVLKIAKERDSALQEAKRWKEMARSQDDSPSRRLHEEFKALMQKCAILDVENHTLFQKLAELETRTTSICLEATARASRIFAEYERLDAMISEDEGRDRGSFWVPYYKEFKDFLASLI